MITGKGWKEKAKNQQHCQISHIVELWMLMTLGTNAIILANIFCDNERKAMIIIEEQKLLWICLCLFRKKTVLTTLATIFGSHFMWFYASWLNQKGKKLMLAIFFCRIGSHFLLGFILAAFLFRAGPLNDDISIY